MLSDEVVMVVARDAQPPSQGVDSEFWLLQLPPVPAVTSTGEHDGFFAVQEQSHVAGAADNPSFTSSGVP